MIEKIKYWFWRHWYMANFPFNSPTRFIGLMRLMTVYDPLFEKEGLDAVKKEHARHLVHCRAKLRDYLND